MDEYEKDLPIVRAAFDKLVAKYPSNFFKMVFVPEVGEFFIRVNDFELAKTDEYRQFIRTLEAELFDRTYCRVIFTRSDFDITYPKGMFEVNNFSPQEKEETEALLHSANYQHSIHQHGLKQSARGN